MLVSDFDFDLPPGLIARHPPAERDGARMLVVDRASGACSDSRFRDLPNLLRPGDLLVLNDSRVIPARLYATRQGLHTQSNSPVPSGEVEVLLTSQQSPTDWLALVKPGRKLRAGERLRFHPRPGIESTRPLAAEILAEAPYGERLLRFEPTDDFFRDLDSFGHIPLPPYMHRPDTAEDRARYQTVYAGAAAHGSAAAPTAGLHFTPAVLEQIGERGIEIQHITLHVGLGTFQPVRVEHLDTIQLHAERYTLPAATAEAVNRARRDGRRIVAAGTTTVRTLEHCATLGPELTAHTGRTGIFIRPGHRFQVVSALLTNFHLPQSTLLMLVSAFAGREHTLAAYRHAVRDRYRFFSYGDCMFLS